MIRGDAFLGERIEVIYKGSGDFTDCMDRIVPAMSKDGKSPSDPHAFCAWYEHEQTGSWPGEKRASVKSTDTFLGGTDRAIEFELLYKTWSDSARAAALDARRQGHSGAPANISTQGGAESHMAAGGYGWEHEGESKHFPGEQEYSHPASNVKIQVRPSGEWHHGAIGGQNSKDLNTYLAHMHGRTAQAA